MKEGILAGDSKLENGWFFTTKTGIYGTDYIQRALITAIGLGANRPQDAIYPTSEGPSALSTYTGAKKYVMALPEGPAPASQWLLVAHDVRRQLFLRGPTPSIATASAPGRT